MFHRPYLLLLIVPLLLLAWRQASVRELQGISFSSTSFLAGMRPTLRQRLTWLPPAMKWLAMTLLIVCLAGPREGRQQTIADAEGIAIQLVVDRSGSMQAMDFQKQETPVDRLTAIKDVVGRFVLGDGDLDGRLSDLIGLVTFAGLADGVTPPTLDHAFLVSQLADTRIADRRSEDGTAIGDAMSLAVEKLAALDRNQEKKIKSKIVILLTDGENNAGNVDPVQAADLAKMMDIKVYTIGVGTRGMAPFPVTNMFGQRMFRQTEVTIDEETLKQIADTTGGQYFRATDTRSLEAIYAEIDQLEKSKVEEKQYVDYRELAVQSIRFGRWTLPPVAFWAFGLLASQLLLKHTIFREFG